MSNPQTVVNGVRINWQPSHNGGWFTGEPFQANAPWATVPMIPEAAWLIENGIKSANPPPGASAQYPGYTRPGNNTLAARYLSSNKAMYPNFICTRPEQPQSSPKGYTGGWLNSKNQEGFSKYAYL